MTSPVIDVDHHHRTGLMVLQPLGGEALQVEIDGEERVRSGLAFGAVELAHDAADGIDLDLDGAGAATQVVLERALHALLAEADGGELQQRIVAAGEVLVRDAAGIADDVAHQLALGIVARLAEIDEHARQVGGVELEPRHFLPAEILAHHHGLGVAVAAQLAQQAVALGLADIEDLVEPLDHDLGAAAAIRRHHGAEVVAVDGERLAGAVEDQPARRRQQAEVDAVLLGQRGEALGVEDLQLVEPTGQRRQQHRLRATEQQGAAGEQARAFAVALAVAHHVVVSPGWAVPRDSSGTFRGSRGRTRASNGASSG